ncbi:MAG: 2-phospho-L-lactate transferase [Spongiibacteraceae bacterium]
MSAVVCLSGGVGGAKLLLGLQRILPAGELTAIINTGDDFDHLGLRICPDIDTALYTLAGLANPELGWGRRDETWTFMQTLEQLGGETWFRLGDGDLALHIERTRRLGDGQLLDSITRVIAATLGIATTVVPMTNDAVRTRVMTDLGELDFQHYFVRLRCEPALQSCRFVGAETATITSAASAALTQSPRAIVIAPSNPYLSIDPILALPGMRELLRASGAPVIAVTPLIGGNAVKGPTAKIMRELKREISPLAIAEHYRGLVDGFVLDECDSALAAQLAIPCAITNTLMRSLADRERVADVALEFADSLRARGAR